MEYDFVVAPGTDPKAIQLSFEGADKLNIDARGDLILHTRGGEIKQPKPLIYPEIKGEKVAIAGRYVLKKPNQVSFQVVRYNMSKPLISDPALVYSTFLGDNGSDFGNGIAVDSAGNTYVVGSTISTGFPATAGAYDRSCGTDGTCKGGGEVLPDTFVTKIAGPGKLQFSSATYSVNEGAGSVTITVTRSNFNTGTVSVNYATSNGTAVAPSDYTAKSGTLTFASNETTKTFSVPITNDTAREANETVNLTLSNPTGGALLGTPKAATLTIVDND